MPASHGSDDVFTSSECPVHIAGISTYDAATAKRRPVRPLSTAPEEDLLIIVKRAVFAWLIADGDMHLKNTALLKIAEPGDRQFRTVRHVSSRS